MRTFEYKVIYVPRLPPNILEILHNMDYYMITQDGRGYLFIIEDLLEKVDKDSEEYDYLKELANRADYLEI